MAECSCLGRVMFLLSVLVLVSEAWRPQGRFGKRLATMGDSMMSKGEGSNLLDNDYGTDPATAVLRMGDITCVRQSAEAPLYSCLRTSGRLIPAEP